LIKRCPRKQGISGQNGWSRRENPAKSQPNVNVRRKPTFAVSLNRPTKISRSQVWLQVKLKSTRLQLIIGAANVDLIRFGSGIVGLSYGKWIQMHGMGLVLINSLVVMK